MPVDGEPCLRRGSARIAAEHDRPGGRRGLCAARVARRAVCAFCFGTAGGPAAPRALFQHRAFRAVAALRLCALRRLRHRAAGEVPLVDRRRIGRGDASCDGAVQRAAIRAREPVCYGARRRTGRERCAALQASWRARGLRQQQFLHQCGRCRRGLFSQRRDTAARRGGAHALSRRPCQRTRPAARACRRGYAVSARHCGGKRRKDRRARALGALRRGGPLCDGGNADRRRRGVADALSTGGRGRRERAGSDDRLLTGHVRHAHHRRHGQQNGAGASGRLPAAGH